MKMNLQKVEKDQIERCINLCERCIENDEKIIAEAKDIISRCEDKIKQVEARLKENRERLTVCEAALFAKIMGEVLLKMKEEA